MFILTSRAPKQYRLALIQDGSRWQLAIADQFEAVAHTFIEEVTIVRGIKIIRDHDVFFEKVEDAIAYVEEAGLCSA